MSDFYTENPNETPEQMRFRLFAMTHKEPSKAADAWIKDKERIAELKTQIKTPATITLPNAEDCAGRSFVITNNGNRTINAELAKELSTTLIRAAEDRITALIETADQQRMKYSEDVQKQRERAEKAEQELIVKIKRIAELRDTIKFAHDNSDVRLHPHWSAYYEEVMKDE